MILRYVSITMLSEITGLDRRTLKKSLANLPIHEKKGKAELYDGHLAFKTLLATQSTQGIEKQLQEEELRIERAKREKLEIEVGRLRGELVPVEEVAREVEREYSFIRSQFRSIPSKLAKPLSMLTDPHDVHLRLTEAVDECLTELTADAKYNDVSIKRTPREESEDDSGSTSEA